MEQAFFILADKSEAVVQIVVVYLQKIQSLFFDGPANFALGISENNLCKFFDLAFAYVTDADKFSVLQSELKEEYYINLFKAMVRN